MVLRVGAELEPDTVGSKQRDDKAATPRMQTTITRGEPPGIVGARARPLVAGCAACEHRGRASHGYRHSVACQRTFARWLTSQTQIRPRAEEIEATQEAPMTIPQVFRFRLRTKTTPPNLGVIQGPTPPTTRTYLGCKSNRYHNGDDDDRFEASIGSTS